MNRKLAYGPVQVHDDLLPPGLYAALLRASCRIGWQFGWNTPSNPGHRYWHHEVGSGRKENTEDVSQQVRQHPVEAFAVYMDWLRTHLVPPGVRVLRYYLNAHTYGTDGWPHTDTDRGEELTAVLYLTPDWKPEWCGETVVFTPGGDIEAAVLPRPNRLLTFPSDRLHAPRPLSKAFEGLRVVLVLKLGSPTGEGSYFGTDPAALASPQELEHLRFLRPLAADSQRLRAGSFAHFWASSQMLQLRGEPPEVVQAALYLMAWAPPKAGAAPRPLAPREALRDRMGAAAERLAHLYLALDRPRCWTQPGPELPLVAGGSVRVDGEDRRRLAAIERARLDEQGLLDPQYRAGLAQEEAHGDR